MKGIKRNILLNPGPATTTDSVKYAQIVPDICPREKEFIDIMSDIRRNLVQIVHGDLEQYEAVLFCGSGTINLDVIMNSLVPEDKKVLVINNGAYSARAIEILKSYHIPYLELSLSYDEIPSIDAIEKLLKEHNDIALVHTTHNETGTGILNPIKEIGALVHRYGLMFSVDTTSTYALLPIDMEKDNLDFVMASSQKGLMAMTGLSFIVGKRTLIKQSKENPIRSFYCNLYKQYEGFMKTGEMRFTPPVQTVYSLKQAIREYWAEGEYHKYIRHKKVWEAIHTGKERLGFKDVIKKEWQAGLVVSILYPDDSNWNFNKIHDYCYERGFTIYPGKISGDDTFRLCALGAITEKDIEEFYQILEEALKECRVTIPVIYNNMKEK